MRSALFVALLAVTGGAFGCAGEIGDAPAVGDTGQLQIPLTTSADDGHTYVLTGAIFDISGPASQSLVAPDDGADVSTELPPGQYTIVLRDGWQLAQRRDGDGLPLPVVATLASKNPMTVRILPGVAAQAAYTFLLGGNTGSLSIHFGVASKVGVIAGHFHVSDDESVDMLGNPQPNQFTGLTGQDLDYVARFPLTGSRTMDFAGGVKNRTYFTGPTDLTFTDAGGSPIATALTQRLVGDAMFLSLDATPDGVVTLTASVFDEGAQERYGFWLGVKVMATLDANGYPQLAEGQGQLVVTDPGAINLQRSVHHATGEWTLSGYMQATGDALIKL